MLQPAAAGAAQLVGAVAGDVGVPGEQRDGDHVAVLAGPAAALGAQPRGCGARTFGSLLYGPKSRPMARKLATR